MASSLSSDTLNPNPDDADVRLPDDSDARPGVLGSSFMSASPADFTSAELDEPAVADDVTDIVDWGSGGDGCDDAPGVTLPDDACFAVSCCLLLANPPVNKTCIIDKSSDLSFNCFRQQLKTFLFCKY